MGGSVAYEFAVQSPKRLSKLVIISSDAGTLLERPSGTIENSPAIYRWEQMKTGW